MNIDRSPKYLRVSLLSACNLSCSYCLPKGSETPAIVAPADRVSEAIRFLYGSGIRKVRFTGGEPTLHKKLPEIISSVKKIDGSIHTAITTNGLLLASIAERLATAGLDSANISLDTMNPHKFQAITGSDKFDSVIRGIETATKHIARVKLNCVLMRGVNDDEVPQLIRFANDSGLDIRFIEYMPNRYSAPGDPRFISAKTVRSTLPWKLLPLPGEPTSAARYFASPELRIRVGFISPISHPFCDACNRLRLTAAGKLYGCLFESEAIDLFELLASDASHASSELKRLIRLKRFAGCRGAAMDSSHLPSFSTLGG